MGMRFFSRFNNFFLRCTKFAITDIVCDCSRKQINILLNNADVPS